MSGTWQPSEGSKIPLLTELPVPVLLADQLGKLTDESIHVQETGLFDVQRMTETMAQKEGQKVLGADFGGDKGATRLFEIRQGGLHCLPDYADDVQGNDGVGYLESLEKTAHYAEVHNIPLGISWGAQLDGSKLIVGPKSKVFTSQLTQKYDGDFKNISKNVAACLNDGPAGLFSAATEAFRRFGADTVLLPINGGGLGMAVVNDGKMYATEAGHTEAVAELNTYHQAGVCGVFGATYLCLEQLGANKAGIEVQWQALTGEYSRARDIEDRYKEGNQLAFELYDHSALIVAHMIQGTANAFDIDLGSAKTAVICHGGAFKFPYYDERVRQILSNQVGSDVQLLATKDYVDTNSNACIEGAAIAALAI